MSKPFRICIAEDDDGILNGYSMAFKVLPAMRAESMIHGADAYSYSSPDQKYEFVCITECEAARDYLLDPNTPPFDLVISDNDTPGNISGAQLIQALRSNQYPADIIYASANTTAMIRLQGELKQQGLPAVDELKKPFSPADLVSAVEAKYQAAQAPAHPGNTSPTLAGGSAISPHAVRASQQDTSEGGGQNR